MPRLVSKFKYMKPGSGVKSIGGYAKYIATREGVEKIDDSQKHAPATVKQEQLIRRILRDFPDAKQSHEYRGLVYECKKYHNAVFVGTDKAGKVRHIHKRSTAAQGSFRGNAPGSEPEYSFHWLGGGDLLYLFEAPIDMLSFISLYTAILVRCPLASSEVIF